jgi:C4-dicarboxylate-specific signal transduction histidine kinase
MPNGGKITINVAQTQKQTTITLADTGEGIPVEAKTKLFTPLFTTKAKGQGLV